MSSELHTYRYPGSRPFQDTPHDRRLFFGRDQEAHELLHLTLAEKLVVVFAVSGLGKSSLINAALVQPLRERGFFPIAGRVNDSTGGPLSSLYKDIAAAIEREGVEILTLPGGHLETRFGLVLQGQAMPAAELAEFCLAKQVPLWLFFKELEFWRRDVLLEPVLILDQLEELFTLHGETRRDEMIAELSCLVRDPLPRSALDALCDPHDATPRAFDSTDLKGPRLKIVLSLREDWLGSLEALSAKIPNILSTRFRLEPLRRARAREAIERPAGLDDVGGETFSFAPEVIDVILDFLAHRQSVHGEPMDEILPSQLQLICHYLEELVTRPDHGRQITLADLGGGRQQAPRELNRILERYYEDRTSRIARGRPLRAIRKLCEKGLIVAGRRVSSDANVLIQRYGVRESDLRRLVDVHLLRSVPRLDSLYYELSHDTLVQPILASLRRRKRQLRFTVAYALTGVLALTVALGSRVSLAGYEALQREQQWNQLRERSRERSEAFLPDPEFLALAVDQTRQHDCLEPRTADVKTVTASSLWAEEPTAEATAMAGLATGGLCREIGGILKQAFNGVRLIDPPGDAVAAGSSRSDEPNEPRRVEMQVSGGARIATLDPHRLRVRGPGDFAQDLSIPIKPLTQVASSADGRQLVTAAEDGTLRLWEIDASGSRIEPVTAPRKAHPEGLLAMKLDPRTPPRLLLTSGKEGGLRLWSLDPVEEDPIRDAALAAASATTVRSITTAVEDAKVSQLQIHAIDQVDERLAIGCEDSSVRYWDGDDWKIFPGHSKAVRAVAFDPSGRWLASSGDDGALRLWSLEPDADPESHRGPFFPASEDSGIRTLVWYPDTRPEAQAVVTGGRDGTLRLWPLAAMAAGRVSPRIIGSQNRVVLSLAFRDDGLLASSGYDGLVRLWDLATGELGHLGDFERFVTSLDFTDSGRLISGSRGGTINIWQGLEERDGATLPLAPPSFHDQLSQYELTAVAASTDGAWLASGSSDGTLSLYRFDSVEQEYKSFDIPGSGARIEALGFDPHHQRLASVSSDRRLRLWSYEGDVLLDFSFHRATGDPTAAISRITFPRAGIVSTSDGKSEDRWDISDVLPTADSGDGQSAPGALASSPPASELRRRFDASCCRLESLLDSERSRDIAKKLDKVLRRACADSSCASP